MDTFEELLRVARGYPDWAVIIIATTLALLFAYVAYAILYWIGNIFIETTRSVVGIFVRRPTSTKKQPAPAPTQNLPKNQEKARADGDAPVTTAVISTLPNTEEKALRVIRDVEDEGAGSSREHAISMKDVAPILEQLLNKFVEDYNLIHGLSSTGNIQKSSKKSQDNREIVFTLAATKKDNVKIEVSLGRTDIKVLASWQRTSSKPKERESGTAFGLEDMETIEKHLWGLMRTIKN